MSDLPNRPPSSAGIPAPRTPRVLPAPEGVVRRSLTITNDTENLQQVRDMVREGVVAAAFPREYLNRVMLAVDEAITNIIEHAFNQDATLKGHIVLTQEVTATVFRIQIEDDGLSYDPKRVTTDIDINRHVEEGRSGGLGIFLMRQIMDVVDYQFEQGVRNRLVLVKYAPGATPLPGGAGR